MWHSMSKPAHQTMRIISTKVAVMCAALLLTACAGLFDLAGKQASLRKEEYKQQVTVLKPIEGVSVLVSYQGGAIYRVQVNNTLSRVINLVWDESAYVNTHGESIRLIHLPRRGDLARDPPAQQAALPIAPGTQLQTEFIGESWLDSARRGAMPTPKDGLKKARLYLTFNIKGKHVLWRGEVTFSAPDK